jgi:hypothetical protein
VRRRRDEPVGLFEDETMTGWIANMIGCRRAPPSLDGGGVDRAR